MLITKPWKSTKCRQENLIQKSVFWWFCMNFTAFLWFMLASERDSVFKTHWQKVFWVEKPSSFFMNQQVTQAQISGRKEWPESEQGPENMDWRSKTLAKYWWCHKPKKVFQIEMFCSLHTARVLRWIKIAELKLGKRYMASMEAFMS